MADLTELFQGEDDEPTPEELFIKEDLSPLDKLITYSKSDLVVHRLFVIRDLENIVQEIGFQGSVQHAIPILKILSEDVEPVVRAAAMEKLPPFANFLVREGQEKGREVVLNPVLHLLKKLVVDKNVQTQANAHEAFVKICSHFEKNDLEDVIFPLISTLLAENSDEDFRVEGLGLLQDLCPNFAKYQIVWKIIPKVIENSVDSSFRVRKGCVEVIAALSSHLAPEDVEDRLLPLFLEFCSDKIWGVRKACAVALPVLSKNLTTKIRKMELMEMFQLLNEDLSRWVKTALLESLGPFIASFIGDPEVPSQLIETYDKMSSGEPDLVLSCAFNFPAVVLTLGPQQWPRLKPIFQKLTGDLQWKTRRTLSFSLHELAAILGQEITEEDLSPTFDLYLRDLDDVKIGVFTNFAKFLSHLGSDQRKYFFKRISDLQVPSEGWRFREILAKQLPELGDLAETEDIVNFLVPQSLLFCKDPVNVVRISSIRGVATILKILKIRGNQEAFERFVGELKKLGTQDFFSGRQFFAILCKELAQSLEPEDFGAYFLPLLVALSNDPIVNVRLVVAEALRGKVSKIAFFQENQFVTSTLERLQRDPDRDVSTSASALP